MVRCSTSDPSPSRSVLTSRSGLPTYVEIRSDHGPSTSRPSTARLAGVPPDLVAAGEPQRQLLGLGSIGRHDRLKRTVLERAEELAAVVDQVEAAVLRDPRGRQLHALRFLEGRPFDGRHTDAGEASHDRLRQ